ncbi:MAG: IS66 family transposase [Bacteroidota bacterium]
MRLPNNISECHQLILVLMRQIELQGEKNKELEARLNQNSGNSSKPPSSDLHKPKRRRGIQGKAKKKGGQKGHKGDTLKMVATEKANEIKPLKPERCSCGQRLLRQDMELHARRQVFDIPDPQLVITEYEQLACSCPNCGKYNIGQFPDLIKAPVQYGCGLRSLMVLLSVKCQLSEQNISELFTDLFGYAVNSGTIQSTLNRAHQQSEPVAQQIKQAALACSILNLDETGIQIENKRRWLHTISNEAWTWLHVHANRGHKALQDNSPTLFDYQGVVVHDCWKPYWKLTLAHHALCNAHLLRELNGLMEQGSEWAEKMHDLLLRLYQKHRKGKQIHRRSHEWRLYSQICQQAFEQEPPPIKKGREQPKKSKGRNLAERFDKYKEAVLRFALHPDIPFTNNQAERDIRPVKGKLKVAGCFRTWKGAQRYARLQSVFSTWKSSNTISSKNSKPFLTDPTFHLISN